MRQMTHDLSSYVQSINDIYDIFGFLYSCRQLSCDMLVNMVRTAVSHSSSKAIGDDHAMPRRPGHAWTTSPMRYSDKCSVCLQKCYNISSQLKLINVFCKHTLHTVQLLGQKLICGAQADNICISTGKCPQ